MNRTVILKNLLPSLLVILIGCHQTRLSKMVSDEASDSRQEISISKKVPAFRAQEPEITLDELLGEPTPDPMIFSTVLTPDLKKRYMGLVECIALALENGRTGDFFDDAGSRQRTSVASLPANSNLANSTDSIRVFAYNPAIAATEIEESLSRFDTFSDTNFFWNRIDEPNALLFSTTAFEEFTNRNKLDTVEFSSGIFRRLPTGGVSGLRFRTDFTDQFIPSNDGQILNPAYRPAFEILFEQPLLQGAGIEINQIRDQHPGSLRQTFPNDARTPGILLARISRNQTELEFERRVHELLFRVEEAYWQLYCAYWDLYSSDNGMKQTHSAWQIAKARYDAGGIGIEDLALIEEQYHFFRSQRIQALGRGQPGRPGVLEAERRLRYIVGLPPEDGTRIIPSDLPKLIRYTPDLVASMADAQEFRPELRQVQEEIKAAQLALAKAMDRLKPDLRFVSRYDVNALDNDLGGSIGNVFARPRHQWELGMRLQFPFGFRGGHSEKARAKLLLAQRISFLQDQKQKLEFSLQRSYRDLVQFKEQYQIRQSQRKAAALQLKARYEKFKAGGDPKQPGSFIDLLLRAQRNWVDSLREEYFALCNFRVGIADFERQKGTICNYENVTISEGPVPPDVIPQASLFLRRWKKAAMLRESPSGSDPFLEPDIQEERLPKFSGITLSSEEHKPGSVTSLVTGRKKPTLEERQLLPPPKPTSKRKLLPPSPIKKVKFEENKPHLPEPPASKRVWPQPGAQILLPVPGKRSGRELPPPPSEFNPPASIGAPISAPPGKPSTEK